MSSHKTLVILEVPFWVGYEYQPYERMTNTYPGCDADVIPETLEIPDDLEQYIWDEYSDQIKKECWEDYKESHRGRY